jgi:hypothetical protein
MIKAGTANLEMVRHVAERLGSLLQDVVFLGGAATALFIMFLIPHPLAVGFPLVPSPWGEG